MLQDIDIQYIKNAQIVRVRIRYKFCAITDAEVRIALKCMIASSPPSHGFAVTAHLMPGSDTFIFFCFL